MRSVAAVAAALTALLFAAPLAAQDLIGFDRANFGKVVLSGNQSAGGDMNFELSVGSYNNESIRNYSPESIFAKLGRSVGRLDILTDTGIFPCTAFIVSDKYILTNYHCVPGILDNQQAKATRIDAVQFVAGYTQQGVDEGTKTYFVSPTPVEAAQDLDFALLEVIGNPSAQFGKLVLASNQPHDGDPYWVIGHPMGEAQRISREKCKANAPALSNNQLLHTCDTLPGNSGSPVIDASLQKVVGLHHAGSSKDAVNFAIPMSLIIERSPILKALYNQSDDNSTQTPTPDPVVIQPPLGDTPQTGNPQAGNNKVCDDLYAEAKTYNACFAYEAYARSCTTHSYVGFANGYIEANCKVAVAPPPEPKPDPKPDPKPEPVLLRPWCGASFLNATERTICSDAYLAGLDEELERVYGQQSASRNDLSQRNWLRNERDACGANRTCISNAITQRIVVLMSPDRGSPQPESAKSTPGNYTLPGSQCYIVVASRTNLAEAQDFIRTRLRDDSGVRVFLSDNGYYGITLTTVSRADAEFRLQQWKSRNEIPSDSYCASGNRYTHEIHWRSDGSTTTPMPNPAGGTWYVDNNNDGGLNLRSGPGTNYGIVVEMEVGLMVREISRQGDWIRLQLPNGTQGWASARYLTANKPWVRQCTGRVVNLDPIWAYNAQTGAGFLSVRTDPSTNKGKRISELYLGDTVKVVARRNGWARLQCVSGQCKNPYRGTADVIGWSSEKYLRIQCN